MSVSAEKVLEYECLNLELRLKQRAASFVEEVTEFAKNVARTRSLNPNEFSSLIALHAEYLSKCEALRVVRDCAVPVKEAKCHT